VGNRQRGRDADAVLSGSEVGARLRFWHTTMAPWALYDPFSRCADLVPAPAEVMQEHAVALLTFREYRGPQNIYNYTCSIKYLTYKNYYAAF
jgi:hypothetical protein